jgi:hypothetical protein
VRIFYLIRLVHTLKGAGLRIPAAMRLRALPFVLITAGAVPPAAAQQAVCYPVRPGETASVYARRLTGRVDSQYASWFRVVDARGRTIPKSQHARILPGWRVCVSEHPAPALAPRAPIGVAQYRPLIDPMLLQYGAAGLVLTAALLAFVAALQILAERQIILDRMKAFGERFVSEFETPLYRYPVGRCDGRDGHPVRSRLRFTRNHRRMEILLAPLDGRTYPNLSDHRKNVEYDIERVLTVIGDQSFKTGRLYSQGRWVVVPFTLAQEDVRHTDPLEMRMT